MVVPEAGTPFERAAANGSYENSRFQAFRRMVLRPAIPASLRENAGAPESEPDHFDQTGAARKLDKTSTALHFISDTMSASRQTPTPPPTYDRACGLGRALSRLKGSACAVAQSIQSIESSAIVAIGAN